MNYKCSFKVMSYGGWSRLDDNGDDGDEGRAFWG